MKGKVELLRVRRPKIVCDAVQARRSVRLRQPSIRKEVGIPLLERNPVCGASVAVQAGHVAGAGDPALKRERVVQSQVGGKSSAFQAAVVEPVAGADDSTVIQLVGETDARSPVQCLVVDQVLIARVTDRDVVLLKLTGKRCW